MILNGGLRAHNDSGIVSRSSDFQQRDFPPEDHELDNAESDMPDAGTPPTERFNNLDPQPMPSPPGGLHPYHPKPQLPGLTLTSAQPYNPHLLSPNPLPNYTSQNSFEPYGPHLAMERWTNQALFSMLEAWQDVIDSGVEQSTLSHPLFQEVTKELIERGIMSVSWRWAVNIEEVDMDTTRAEHLGPFLNYP